MGILPLAGWWTVFDGYVFNDTNRNGVQGRRRAGPGRLHADDAQARQLADGPRHDGRDHRPDRLLQVRSRLPDDPVAGDGGLRRPALHHRRHLPGRQPADADHGPGRRRGRQRAAHHRPRRPHGLGQAHLRRTAANGIDPATAASSAPSATTPRATSSTRAMPRSKTGSRACPISRSSCSAQSTCGTTRAASPAMRPDRLRARHRRLASPRASSSTPT